MKGNAHAESNLSHVLSPCMQRKVLQLSVVPM